MPNTGGTYTWSKNPAANSSADNTVNWAEGMAPSVINDSARSMMASVAKWRDDISGALVTTGSAAAYAVSSNQNFDTLSDMNGMIVAFTPHVTNGPGPVMLNVDGLGAKFLRTAPNADLLAGVLIQGTPYVAIYNNTDGAFYLRSGYGNPYNIPLGGGMDYWGATPPNSSFAFPYGQQISQTTYASLYTLFGPNRFGSDAGGLFFLPDKRGRISVALDTMGGPASGRVTTANLGVDGTTIGAVGGGPYAMQRSDLPNVNAGVSVNDPGHTHQVLAKTVSDFGLALTAGGSVPAALDGTIGNSGSGNGNTQPTTTGITASLNLNGGVTQTNIKTMPPAIVVPYLIRII